MSTRLDSIVRNSLSILLLVFCAACASFRGEELPQRDPGELERSERLPPVTYELANAYGTTVASQAGTSDACIDRVLRKAFSEVERRESEAGLHLDFHYTTRTRQPTFTMGMVLLSIVSLGLIPAYGRGDLSLTVLVEVDGRIAGRYGYEDHVDTWVHLFVIPWAYSHDPVEVEEAVLENMLLNFLHDLRRDLPGFPKPAAS